MHDEEDHPPEQLELIPVAPEILPALPVRRANGKRHKAAGYKATVERHMPSIVDRLIELAMTDPSMIGIAAAKLLMDRTWPRPRQPALEINLAGSQRPPDLRGIMHAVVAGVVAGDIPVELARDISALVESCQHLDRTLPGPAAECGKDVWGDDPREELARRWLRLYDAQRPNGSSSGSGE